jgi:hypothetical protein
MLLFVPPFPVTILNHSPRLMFSVPSNKVQKKWAKPVRSDFHFFEPTWYITDVITTGAEGHFVEQHADRCPRCILQKTTFEQMRLSD